MRITEAWARRTLEVAKGGMEMTRKEAIARVKSAMFKPGAATWVNPGFPPPELVAAADKQSEGLVDSLAALGLLMVANDEPKDEPAKSGPMAALIGLKVLTLPLEADFESPKERTLTASAAGAILRRLHERGCRVLPPE